MTKREIKIAKVLSAVKQLRKNIKENKHKKKNTQAKYKKKLLIIQIDGLSYDDLEYCVEKGYAPWMKKLLQKEAAQAGEKQYLKQYFPGLPCSTPVIQAAIMYGDSSPVAGFRFVDKQKNKTISFVNPLDAYYIESNYYTNKDNNDTQNNKNNKDNKDNKDLKKNGLLSDYGSSYFNHFSGGAERSIFTMATLWKQNKIQKLKQTDLHLIFLANPFRIIKVAYLAGFEIITEYLEALWEHIVAFIKRRKAKVPFIFSIVRMNMNVISRELTTLGAIIDMKRSTPIIYINYVGYDEIGHHRGPSNKSAYRSIRAIDRNIKRIYAKKKQDYDIMILSDHGQQQAMPFKRIYKQSLGDFIKQLAAVAVSSDDELDDKDITLEYMQKDIEEMGRKNKLAKLLTMFKSKENLKKEKNKVASITVAISSNLAQIYFLQEKKRIDKKEIELLYPEFIEKLSKHPGIGVVLGKHESNFFIITKNGTIFVTPQGEIKASEEYKLFLRLMHDYEIKISPEIFLQEIIAMLQKPFSGDLTIIGSMIDGKAISFADHFGAHGGFGGKQTNAFIITNQEIKQEITNAEQIYTLIRKKYCKE